MSEQNELKPIKRKRCDNCGVFQEYTNLVGYCCLYPPKNYCHNVQVEPCSFCGQWVPASWRTIKLRAV